MMFGGWWQVVWVTSVHVGVQILLTHKLLTAHTTLYIHMRMNV